MRFLLLAAFVVAAPAFAQDAPLTLDDATTTALAPYGSADVSNARLLSPAELDALGVEADEPLWAAPLRADLPSLGYELPPSVLPSEKEVGIGILVAILVTGGGQLYAGDTSKGLRLLAIGIGAPVVGFIVTRVTDNATPYLIGALVGLGAWVYGIIETPDDVRAANARNGFALAPSVVRTEAGAAGGLSLRASF